MSLEVARRVKSPLSILKSAQDGVGFGGNAHAPAGEGIVINSLTLGDGELTVSVRANSDGTARAYLMINGRVPGDLSREVAAGWTETIFDPNA